MNGVRHAARLLALALGGARPTGRFLALLGLLIPMLAIMAGCRASTQDVVTYQQGQLPRPVLVLVHDFTSMPGEGQLDTGIGARLRQRLEGTSLTEQQVELRQ